ncbi:MAG: sulfatase-like hydrolase/transferase [Caldilinea sp.]
MQQANILLIHVDQHRFDCVGANGHPEAHTPNLDRLAAEGVNFTHAFCPIAVCMPARTSLMTGLYATQHGCLVNDPIEGYRPASGDVSTFTRLLKAMGYRLGCVGKWGIGIDASPAELGFDDYVPSSAYRTWRQAQGLPPTLRTNTWFGEADTGVTPEQSMLGWGADQVIHLLEQYASAPFFLRWDPEEPHLPSRPPEPYASLVKPEDVPPWLSFPDPLMNKPAIQRQQLRSWGIDGWTWAQWAPVVAYYLGVVALIDHQVGRILARLDALGLTGRTLVIYTSDHGDLCGAHGMIDKHYVMYDDVMRVPLIMRWPQMLPAGCTVEAFVTPALDLATTFSVVAGAEAPHTFQGYDLIALANGGQAHRDMVFGSYHGAQFGAYSQRMVRTRDWKYIWNPTAEDELYDMTDDPGELRNRAADPACGESLQTLRAHLVDWMGETKDPLLNEWTRRQLIEGHKV